MVLPRAFDYMLHKVQQSCTFFNMLNFSVNKVGPKGLLINRRIYRLYPCFSVAPKHMDFIVRRFDGVNITTHFHIAPHALVVNIESQIFRNLTGLFG